MGTFWVGGDLDEKMTSAGYKRERNKKTNFVTFKFKNAYFWIISLALEAIYWSRITSCILKNVLNFIYFLSK